MPLFFLAFLGLGFSNMPIPGMQKDINYIDFLIPGIIGMSMLFISIFAGISVLWDREFGFLKEIMVALVNRVFIVVGRMMGGATTTLIHGGLLIVIAVIIGFKIPGIISLLMAFVFILLISTTFIELGLVFASKMKNMQGFNLIMNFVIFPVFLLSGALFSLLNLPEWFRYLPYVDPLTYGVDGLRSVLIDVSVFLHNYWFLSIVRFQYVYGST